MQTSCHPWLDQSHPGYPKQPNSHQTVVYSKNNENTAYPILIPAEMRYTSRCVQRERSIIACKNSAAAAAGRRGVSEKKG